MAEDEVRRLFEEGGGKESLRGPFLRPFETPPPESPWLVSRPRSPQEQADLQETARLVREAAPRLTARFGLSPWRVFQVLRRISWERKVSPLQITQRLLAALE